MTNHDLSDLQRAADALRTGLAAQAEMPDFVPLAVDELPAASGGAGRARWIGVAVGVAAVAAALSLVVPNLVGSGGIPAAPAPAGTPSVPSQAPETGAGPSVSPSAPEETTDSGKTPGDVWIPTEGWQAIAAPPIAPRRDAVTAWVDGTYLIVGGFGDAPCADAGDCLDPVELLTDGARYDPTTGTWRKVADAPAHLFSLSYTPHPSVAVLGDSVYVFGGGEMFAYRAESDRWESVPAPKEAGTLYATGRLLVNVRWFSTGDEALRFDTFDPVAGSWTSHPPVKTPKEDLADASVVGDHLVVMAVGSDTLWMALVDPSTDAVTELGWTPVVRQRPVAVDVGGLVAWPRGGGGRNEPEQEAWFLDPETREFASAALLERSRGLTGWNGGYQFNWYITTDNALSMRGQLYDPSARTWIEVPDLPVSDHDPLVIGGASSVLACFGYSPEQTAYGKDCALLTLP